MWKWLIALAKSVFSHPQSVKVENSRIEDAETLPTTPVRQQKLSRCYYCGGAGLVEDSGLNGYLLPGGRAGLNIDDFDIGLSKCPICKGAGYIENLP